MVSGGRARLPPLQADCSVLTILLISVTVFVATLFPTTLVTPSKVLGATQMRDHTGNMQREVAGTLQPDDYVFVLGTFRPRHALAQAGRMWRKNIRTLIATDATNVSKFNHHKNEKWLYYPDVPGISQYPGDTRQAMLPILAYREYIDKRKGSFKWLLYGDDDTVFFSRGVLGVTKELDHEMPYLIADNPYPKIDPQTRHFRCVPCSVNITGVEPQNLCGVLHSCSCTLEALREFKATFREEKGKFYKGDCVAKDAASIDGGAGAILSIGLLKSLNLTKYEECVHSLHKPKSSGSDYLLSYCIKQQGWGLTYPGHTVNYPGENVFDAIDVRIMATRYLSRSFTLECDANCVRKLNSMVTCHVRWAGKKNASAGARYFYKLAALYDAFISSEIELELLEND